MTDDTVISLAQAWAIQRFPLLGRTLRPSITAIERQTVERILVVYTIRARRIVVSVEPLVRKTAATGVIYDPAEFDRWAPGIQETLAGTRVVATCPHCHGTMRQVCGECLGEPDRVCADCQGSGEGLSDRSHRMIRCRTCRGRGRRQCACRDGIVTCSTCHGKGAVTAWLTLQETTRTESRTAGDTAFIESAGKGESEDRITRDSFEAIGQPERLAALGHAEVLRFLPDPHRERVVGIGAVRETSTRASVSYEIAGLIASVDVQGWDDVVKPRPASEDPLVALRRRVRWAALASFVASMALVNWFAGRHGYYRESDATGELGLLGLAMPFAAGLLLCYAARPSARRTALKTLAALVPILSLIAGQTWLVATTGPTVEHAQTLAAAGQHEPARREAQAVVELGVEAPRARVIHDDEQLELIRALREPRLLWQLASQSTFLTGDGRKRAEAIALRRTLDVAGDLLRTNDFQRSLSTLEMIPTAYRRTSEVSERAITVRTAAIEPLWRTISSNEPSRVRLAACGPAELLLKELATRGTTPDTARRVQATCASLTAGELERVRREQKAAKLAALKARQREGTEARRREQVARSRALAPLLCRDGSLSPTCICGGSRRGCCSHHGGVAGCS